MINRYINQARLDITEAIRLLDGNYDWATIMELQDAISCLGRAQEELKKKEPLHTHVFKYIGHGHNDDIYECECGELQHQ